MRQNKVKLRELTALRENNMRVMKVICPACGADARIHKRNQKHRQLADIYCACTDLECGHTFVSELTFRRTLSPSAKSKETLLREALDGLTENERQLALELLTN